MKYNKDNFNVLINYDLDKLSIKQAELFEIANKYHHYKRTNKILGLKPFYFIVCHISLFLAKFEARNALKNSNKAMPES